MLWEPGVVVWGAGGWQGPLATVQPPPLRGPLHPHYPFCGPHTCAQRMGGGNLAMGMSLPRFGSRAG